MKTLYVSDLDGTLLGSDARVSEFTSAVINKLVENGLLFSYATARSLTTVKQVTQGLKASAPLIVHNGAFIIDNATEKVLRANYFDGSVQRLLDRLFAANVFPIVYALIDGRERFSYCPHLRTRGMKAFLDMRKGDERTKVADTPEELKRGNIFYITCIDEPEKLLPLYDEYREHYYCVYQKDIYTHEQWLEIMPKAATKSNAMMQVKSMLGCERVIAFGDGKNDIELFKAADESYAVSNANDELKKIATGIIPSNADDGVAKWLKENAAPVKDRPHPARASLRPR